MQDIYQEIESIEADYAKGNIDPTSIYRYRSLVFQIRQPKRLFETMIKYKFYEHKATQHNFFSACYFYGQKAIYDKYMPDYFLKIIQSLINQKAPYQQWLENINYWQSLNSTVGRNRQYNRLALHFIATIATLHFDAEKQDLLQAILKHPIYKKMIPICNEFFQRPDMRYIDKLEQLCFDHIINVRKTYNFNDPWVNVYSDFTNSDEYKSFMQPYYDYMDNNNIGYRDKLIFCLSSSSLVGHQNIGDIFKYTQAIIHWSQYHNISLIALLTPRQASWINIYFRDYFAYIITLDPDVQIPVMMRLLYPDVNRAVAVSIDMENIPYYLPLTYKLHYNHYIDENLHKSDADTGNLIPICDIPETIKIDNQKLFKSYQLHTNKTILIAYDSVSMNGVVMSDTILREFWLLLIKHLKYNGFTPIINLSKADKQHYFGDDIMGLHIPLSHIVDFVNNIAGFIGARSGLCDLLCATNENIKKYNVTPIEYIDWGNDLVPYFHEIKFTFDDMQQHIDNIIDSLNGKNVKAFENQQHYGYLALPDFSTSL